jgi:hypothetical protein
MQAIDQDCVLVFRGDSGVLSGQVTRQFLRAADGYQRGRSAFHLGVLEQHAFDLAQVDAVSSDLHLAVRTAQIGDLAVGRPPAEVAGAVEPAAVGCEGVHDEAIGGLLREPDIAPCHPGPADTNLADLTHLHGLTVLVEQHDRVGRHRPPNGHRFACDQFPHVAVTVASVGP